MPATETKTEKRTGFACPCPLCGATEGLVVRTSNLAIECTECGETVEREELMAMVEATLALLRWLDAAPVV